MGGRFMRLLIVLHRYIGVAVGLLMAVWCLSGFVMMYQGYPRLDEGERLRALTPLRVTPEQARAPLDIPADAALSGFRLEMMGGHPVLHLQRDARTRQAFDLATGQAMEAVTPVQALGAAHALAAGRGIAALPADLGVIAVDQWTVGGVNRAGPMHHYRFGDPAATELYVAERTGQVVQATTRGQRVTAWLGAIPHWLYPTILRSKVALWDAVVVWTAITGTFLTAIGLYIGVARFKRYKSGRWSPYRGWFYWHHMIGLVFGVLTLTWVFSGLLTMSPWGFLDSAAGRQERRALSGTITGTQIKQFLALTPALAQGGWAAVEAAPLGGKLYVLAAGHDGRAVRLNALGQPSPLTLAEARTALQAATKAPIAAFERLDREDAYYYSGYEHEAVLPVYRARLADAQATTFYLDGQTGRMLRAVDAAGRQGRWLREGLHDFDFAPLLRSRPLWDVVVWILLSGVTAVCVTGAWMSWLRIQQDLAGLRLRRAKPKT
jgi:hypothetical protein